MTYQNSTHFIIITSDSLIGILTRIVFHAVLIERNRYISVTESL